MRKNWKYALQSHLRDFFSLYVFIFVLFLMGIVFGAVTVNSLSHLQKNDLFEYLSLFFGQVQNGSIAEQGVMFKQSFLHNARLVGLMWILGLSIIGLPIILVLIFLKGVVVGFTVGFLVNQLGWHGFMLSFVSVMPQNLLLIPAFIIFGTAALSFSLKLMRQLFIKKTTADALFPAFMRYTMLMIIIIIAVGAASSFEAYLSPVLMKSVIKIIY